MIIRRLLHKTVQFLLALSLLSAPDAFRANSLPQSAPNIAVSGQLAAAKEGRSRTYQGTVIMDIPSGFHVNSARPLEKFLIATELQLEAPKGVRLGRVTYPRPVFRKLKFSKKQVSVYEGRAEMRFMVTVPPSVGSDIAEVKARLRYQSCNDDFCFPPQTRELRLPIK